MDAEPARTERGGAQRGAVPSVHAGPGGPAEAERGGGEPQAIAAPHRLRAGGLLDLHPRRDAARAGLANGVASAGGLGLGFLVSSALVQLGSAPRVLPYALLLVLFAAAFAGAYWMPEPVLERSSFRLTPQRPSVPAGIRHAFLLASLAVIASWSLGGLFFSLGPGLSAQLFRSSSVLVAGTRPR